MSNPADAYRVFISSLFSPQYRFLFIYIAAVGTVLVLNAVFRHSWHGVLSLLLMGLGYLSFLADRRTLEAIPTFFPSKPEKETATMVSAIAGFLVAILTLALAISGTMKFGIVVVIVAGKLIATAILAACAFEDYRQNVFPLVLQFPDDKIAFDNGVAARIEQILESRRHRSARELAVHDARLQVTGFFNLHRQELEGLADERWLYTTCQASIPEGATAQQAFDAASQLIGQLEKLLKSSAERKRSLKKELADVEQAVRRLQSNPAMDPDVKAAELRFLETRRSQLHQQQSSSPASI